jgi:hypothetical protein
VGERGLYAGAMGPAWLAQFRKVGNQVQLVAINTDFRADGEAAFQSARQVPPADSPPGFAPPQPEPGDALAVSGEATTMYFTTLPWVHFTAFTHARPGHAREEGTPRVVFGGVQADSPQPGAAQWMPLQLDVHHALMDGLQAGRWLQSLQAALAAPQDWLG